MRSWESEILVTLGRVTPINSGKLACLFELAGLELPESL